MTPLRLLISISVTSLYVWSTAVSNADELIVEDQNVEQAAHLGDPFPVEFVDEAATIVDPEFARSMGRWPNFAAYLKAGPSFSLGDGFFGDDGRVGFALIGGVREHLFPNSGPWFLDFGAAFVTNGGRDATTTILGVDNQGNISPDAFTSTLRELKRGSVHSAIGFYYQPIKDVNYDLLFSLRFGGRIGHAKGVFERIADPTTGPNVDPTKEFADNDTFLGLFAGLESVLATQEFAGGDLKLVVDAEVANDWIELEGLKKAGLPTASVLFGLTVRR